MRTAEIFEHLDLDLEGFLADLHLELVSQPGTWNDVFFDAISLEPSSSDTLDDVRETCGEAVGDDELATYYGDDFGVLGNEARFEASLGQADGTVLRRPFGSVWKVSDHRVDVHCHGAQFGDVDRTRGPVLALGWGNDTVRVEGGQSVLPVMIRAPPQAARSHVDVM